MKNYEICNEELIDILEQFRYTYIEKYDIIETNTIFSPEFEGEADWYTGEGFMRQIISMKENHSGAAEKSYSVAIKPDHYNGKDSRYILDYSNLNYLIQSELGTQNSALSQFYPSNGFIGWHNNANASAYNLILTWSETGEGWFKYIDPKTHELITMKDSSGWTLKAGYFGSYGSGNVVYHAARTYCPRITLSYVLGHDKSYWQDCIEHISTK